MKGVDTVVFMKWRAKRYLIQLQREYQEIRDHYSEMADLWSLSNHNKLRQHERLMDNLRDQIWSLIY